MFWRRARSTSRRAAGVGALFVVGVFGLACGSGSSGLISPDAELSTIFAVRSFQQCEDFDDHMYCPTDVEIPSGETLDTPLRPGAIAECVPVAEFDSCVVRFSMVGHGFTGEPTFHMASRVAGDVADGWRVGPPLPSTASGGGSTHEILAATTFPLSDGNGDADMAVLLFDDGEGPRTPIRVAILTDAGPDLVFVAPEVALRVAGVD